MGKTGNIRFVFGYIHNVILNFVIFTILSFSAFAQSKNSLDSLTKTETFDNPFVRYVCWELSPDTLDVSGEKIILLQQDGQGKFFKSSEMPFILKYYSVDKGNSDIKNILAGEPVDSIHGIARNYMFTREFVFSSGDYFLKIERDLELGSLSVGKKFLQYRCSEEVLDGQLLQDGF